MKVLLQLTRYSIQRRNDQREEIKICWAETS